MGKRNFTRDKQKIGIFPGSFDPLHRGHLKLIELAFQQVCFKKILLLPIINLRKPQTPIRKRFCSLLRHFLGNAKVIVLYYNRPDYWRFIDGIVRKSKGKFYRLMAETCYCAYPEVGFPPSRDEPDTLTEILRTQYIVVMPSPPTNHHIPRAKLMPKVRKKIITLKIPEGENIALISSLDQKIKKYPFLGLQELKYNEYYRRRGKSAIFFKEWYKKYWYRTKPKIGLAHGTFDLIHDGHLSLWEEAIKQLNLDGVFVWPSLYPLHKESIQPFRKREKSLFHFLYDHPRIHLLQGTQRYLNDELLNKKEKNIIKKIYDLHERVVDLIRSNLSFKTRYYRLFGSDSINCYIGKNFGYNPLVTILQKGSIGVLERTNHPLPKKLPKGVIVLHYTNHSRYFAGLSASLVKDIDKNIGHKALRLVQSKHIPQNMVGDRANLFEKLSQKVGYKYIRIGLYRGYTHRKDISFVHGLANGEISPVKIVITKDGRLWADNTHRALACMIKYGKETTINKIPHYYVDLRGEFPIIVHKPKSLAMPNLNIAVLYAKEIQERLLLGWRPQNISFTLGELFDIGNYGALS